MKRKFLIIYWTNYRALAEYNQCIYKLMLYIYLQRIGDLLYRLHLMSYLNLIALGIFICLNAFKA